MRRLRKCRARGGRPGATGYWPAPARPPRRRRWVGRMPGCRRWRTHRASTSCRVNDPGLDLDQCAEHAPRACSVQPDLGEPSMSKMIKLTTTLRPDMMLAGTQHGLACWSQACAEIAQGLMAAGMASVELANTLYGVEAGDWATMTGRVHPHEAGERFVSTARARYEAALKAYRKINDDLAAHVFKAAETLTSGLTDEPPRQP